MTDINELIERLERLGADEVGDVSSVSIWHAVDPVGAAYMEKSLRSMWYIGSDLTSLMANNCEPYGESLDAAEWILPVGFYLRLEPRFDADRCEVHWIAFAVQPLWERYNPVHDDWFVIKEARHPDKYMAACLAALKARAAT